MTTCVSWLTEEKNIRLFYNNSWVTVCLWIVANLLSGGKVAVFWRKLRPDFETFCMIDSELKFLASVKLFTAYIELFRFLFDKTLFIPFHRDQMTKETLFHRLVRVRLQKIASFERTKVTRTHVSQQQNNSYYLYSWQKHRLYLVLNLIFV